MKTKKILLIRHAKSSWEFDVSDRERPLKQRGLKDINLVSNAFKEQNFVPDKIFSSPATRALSTCRIFMNIMDYNSDKLEIIEDLYDFSGHNVITFLKALNDSNEKVIIFGHNHAFTSICNIFGDDYIDNLPTSGLVLLELQTDTWQVIEKGVTKLKIFPRDLK